MDERLLILINREWTHPVFDWVMAIASSYDFCLPFFILAAILTVWRGGFRGRMCVFSLAIVLLVSNQAVGAAKRTFDRPRPNQHLPNVRTIDLDPQTSPRVLALGKPLFDRIQPDAKPAPTGGGRSFPSGHVANLFAAATVLAVFFRRRGWLAYFAAALVGYSRVYTGAHHPSDVIVTGLMSVAFTLLLLALLGWLWERFGGRFAPGVHANHPEFFGGSNPPAAV